ncbi:MAG TPA: glycosyltransferase [Pseudomonadales bacterium]|nr:glycosyltransferase [Pseudomonadales bacterium]
MRVLMLVQDQQRANLDFLYQEIGKHCELDLRRLSSSEQADLEGYFRQIEVAHYERILFFLRFKKEIRQLPFIRTVPNLVILEHDAFQNYYPSSKYQGKFSRHYRALPWARVIVSGYGISRKLQAEGFDACFVSKGYDDSVLRNLQLQRDIEFAFVGSLKNSLYVKRKEMLEEAQKRFDLTITRTNSGEEYLQTLNRVRFFMSCDYGFGEYMLKNFEAMACGCVLFTWDQGAEENQALGFKDMENVVLYKTLDEVETKLAQLRGNPALADSIARAGQQLAESQYGFSQVAKRIVQQMQAPLREKQAASKWDKLRYFFYR